jgi:hypothetical protein
MSSPVRHADDVDAALVYAPPWARNEPRGGAPLEQVWETRRSRGVSGSFDAVPRAFSGDRAMRDLQRRFSLDPESVPEPPRPLKRESVWKKLMLRLGAFAAVVALLAWGAVAVPGLKLFGSEPAEAGFPALRMALERIAQDPARASALTPLAPRDEPSPTKLEPAQSSSPAVSDAKPAEPAPAALSQPASDLADSRVEIDPQEIAVLLKRGQDALTGGDFASARLLLRRAAAAGNAMAALSLGATYDPQVIARLRAVGAEPDPELARRWYKKAQALGSDAAAEQLAKLEQSRQ